MLLAGGLALRMGGGDKSLQKIGHKPILEHVITRFAPQCARLVLNVNGTPERFAHYGLPVIADSIAGHAGPLAGILAVLDWVADNHPACTTIASVATDSPFLPTDLVMRLQAARKATQTPLACAQSGGRIHPPFALWPVSLRATLRQAMLQEDLRKMDTVMTRLGCAYAEWGTAPYDPFFNINHPDDRDKAEAIWNRMNAGDSQTS